MKDKKYFKEAKHWFFSIDFTTLIPLALGIAVAFLTLANLIALLLDIYPAPTFAFFFGLILASAFYVFLTHKKLFHGRSILFVVIGVFCGFMIVGLEGVQLDHSLLMIFASGTISFCAMILPGLSGAFVLLVLGQYSFLLNVLRDLTRFEFGKIIFVIAYGLGGIVGILGFSRVLSFLFSKYKSATIAFIIGLMIGALRKPGIEIINQTEHVIFTGLALCLGLFVVTIFSIIEWRKNMLVNTRIKNR